jgi:hypothetical protein
MKRVIADLRGRRIDALKRSAAQRSAAQAREAGAAI